MRDVLHNRNNNNNHAASFLSFCNIFQSLTRKEKSEQSWSKLQKITQKFVKFRANRIGNNNDAYEFSNRSFWYLINIIVDNCNAVFFRRLCFNFTMDTSNVTVSKNRCTYLFHVIYFYLSAKLHANRIIFFLKQETRSLTGDVRYILRNRDNINARPNFLRDSCVVSFSLKVWRTKKVSPSKQGLKREE